MIKTNSILLNTTIKQVSGNIVSDMNGEKVMLSIKKGKYYNLGEIGGRIWEVIENPISVLQIITSLMAEYDVDHAKCESQVVSFLDSLLKEELIETQEVEHS